MNSIVVCLVVLLNMVMTLSSLGQTVYIPDPNFRQFLVTNYPDLMDANQNLKLSAASSFQANLNLDSLNISNAEGIQYFIYSPSIDLSYNNLTSVPDLSGLTGLKLIKLNHNKLTSFPKLPKGHFISGFYIQNNHLTFEDLLELATYNNIANRLISPQELIVVPPSLSIIGRSTIKIDLGIDAGENNTYSWSKGSIQDYLVTNKNVFEITSLSLNDTGTYKCTIKNNDPEWTTIGKPLLYTTELKLIADSCYKFNQIKYNTSPIECLKDGQISIDLTTVNAPVSSNDYELQIQNKDLSTSIISTNGVFYNLKDSEYYLTYSDTTGCKLTRANPIKVNKNTNECPEIIITPDGDNNHDDYFIEDTGKIKIYNRSGLLIRELTGPVTWDGSDSQGKYSMGIYIIQTETRTFNVYVYL